MRNDSNSRYFVGAEPKFETVLALSSERIDKKLPFEQFKDKLVHYVDREFGNGDDIVYLLSRAICYHDSYQIFRDRLRTIVLSNYKNQYQTHCWRFIDELTVRRQTIEVWQ